MPTYCSAFGCKSTGGRDNVIFHHFPRQKNLAAQWAAAVKRKPFQPSKSSTVCSNHFRDSDYYQNISLMRRLGLSIKSVRLKPGAVPTIFAHHSRGSSPSPTPAVAEKQKREILAELLSSEVTGEPVQAQQSSSNTESSVPAGTSLLKHPCMASIPPGTSLLRRSHHLTTLPPVACTDSTIPSTPPVDCHSNTADPAQRTDEVSETESSCPVSASKFVQVLVRIPTCRVRLQANLRTKKKSHSTQT